MDKIKNITGVDMMVIAMIALSIGISTDKKVGGLIGFTSWVVVTLGSSMVLAFLGENLIEKRGMKGLLGILTITIIPLTWIAEAWLNIQVYEFHREYLQAYHVVGTVLANILIVGFFRKCK